MAGGGRGWWGAGEGAGCERGGLLLLLDLLQVVLELLRLQQLLLAHPVALLLLRPLAGRRWWLLLLLQRGRRWWPWLVLCPRLLLSHWHARQGVLLPLLLGLVCPPPLLFKLPLKRQTHPLLLLLLLPCKPWRVGRSKSASVCRCRSRA